MENLENNKEMIAILYNKCYGGFILSKKAVELYNTKMLEINSEYKPILYDENKGIGNIERHNKIWIDVYNELGNDFNGSKYSNIKIKYIEKKYQNSYDILEYDGFETVRIDLNKYKLECIKDNIINNDISLDEKINQISKIIFQNN
jgi:hypothetical protein